MEIDATTPNRRILLTLPFVEYVDFYHPQTVHRLHTSYPNTFLPEGLEVEGVSKEDEQLVLSLYEEFIKYQKENPSPP